MASLGLNELRLQMSWCQIAATLLATYADFMVFEVLYESFYAIYISNTTLSLPLTLNLWVPYYCGALSYWGQVTHICVSKLTIIGSDIGLSPGGRQAIIWTNAGILLIGPFGTNFNETSIDIHTFSFKKIHLKLSSGKWQPFCLGLNVL